MIIFTLKKFYNVSFHFIKLLFLFALFFLWIFAPPTIELVLVTLVVFFVVIGIVVSADCYEDEIKLNFFSEIGFIFKRKQIEKYVIQRSLFSKDTLLLLKIRLKYGFIYFVIPVHGGNNYEEFKEYIVQSVEGNKKECQESKVDQGELEKAHIDIKFSDFLLILVIFQLIPIIIYTLIIIHIKLYIFLLLGLVYALLILSRIAYRVKIIGREIQVRTIFKSYKFGIDSNTLMLNKFLNKNILIIRYDDLFLLKRFFIKIRDQKVLSEIESYMGKL